MASNSMGEIFRITTFGESHGPAIGVVVDGCPAGLALSVADIQADLDRRRPGQSHISSPRNEPDRVEVLSGIFEGKTTGTPIAMLIRNTDARPADYQFIEQAYRPSHADYTYEKKYGLRDHRGGGRSSARATAAIVAGGAVAKKLLSSAQIQVAAFVVQVGTVRWNVTWQEPIADLASWVRLAESNAVRCPVPDVAAKMEAVIEQARNSGDTVGGIVAGVVVNCPPGLGEPVFGKLQADLAKAMMSINAVHGFEYGSGFAGASMKGSDHNDSFYEEQGRIRTRTNFSGGIQGGISNGMDIYFRVAFKPVATIKSAQQTVTSGGASVELQAAGRHDPCVVPRAVPIVEAAAALVIADHYLRDRCARL